jgi:hypothetical protein
MVPLRAERRLLSTRAGELRSLLTEQAAVVLTREIDVVQAPWALPHPRRLSSKAARVRTDGFTTTLTRVKYSSFQVEVDGIAI